MFLVTGGLGFIGSHTTKALLDQGEEVVAMHHHASYVPSFLQAYLGKHLFVERADVTKIDDLEALGAKHHVTHIIHLAAPKFGALDIVEDLQANIQGYMNVIRLSRAWKVKRLVVASSIGLYGNSPNPLREDALLPLSGANPIAANKKIFEIMSDAVATRADMDIVLVRPSAIWGPLGRSRSPFFSLPQMVHAAAHGAGFDGLGPIYAEDGIDMYYVKDCGKAIALLATAPQLNYRLYNIGSGRATTNSEIAASIRELEPTAQFDLQPGHRLQTSTDNPYMDITRLQEAGFQADYAGAKGIADYLAWLRDGNEQ